MVLGATTRRVWLLRRCPLRVSLPCVPPLSPSLVCTVQAARPPRLLLAYSHVTWANNVLTYLGQLYA